MNTAPNTPLPVAWPAEQTASMRRMAARLALPLAVAMGLALAAWLPLALADTGGATITVCPAGPPACDYPTIQQGMNAAAVGDTVWVEPGTYQGPVTLKSHVALRSSQGREVTTIVADQGPILFAWHVRSASFSGFAIDGTHTMTNAVGILAIDSQLTLTGTAIIHMHGADGTAANPDGSDATGIEAFGAVEMTIDDTAMRDIQGGKGYLHAASNGGQAAGVSVTGEGFVEASGLSIEGLRGGDSNLVFMRCWSGGDATAIETSGAIDLHLRNSLIRDAWGGTPCRMIYNCVNGAGAVAGVSASGGSVTVVNSRIQDLSSWRSIWKAPDYAIRTTGASDVVLEGNVISQLNPFLFTDWPHLDNLNTAPMDCTPPPGTMMAIASYGDQALRATANQIDGIHGRLVDGMGIGIDVSSTSQVELLDNVIHDVSGGTGYGHDGCPDRSACALGIHVADAVTATVDSNHIGMITGGDAIVTNYLCMVTSPGTATGIGLNRVGSSLITNNIVRDAIGGKGVRCGAWPPASGTIGGDSEMLHISGGQAVAANNVFHRARGGAGGAPEAPSGKGYGVFVEGDAQVELANNATTDTSVAFASAPPAQTLGNHNAFWRNAADYDGLPAGPNDVHAEPGFVDLTTGNFMLHLDSPLIDAGRSEDAPDYDIEGDPRPLDGNDDGVALVDIGVDEFWRGLSGSSVTAQPLTVHPGDVITYHITVVNDSTRHVLAPVTVTSALPQEIDYVAGSLYADAGLYDYIEDLVRWWGALPPGGRVQITYQATVAALPPGPRSITTNTVLDEPIGHPLSIDSVVYIDPLTRYFPLAARR